jgi:hypothetical protein
VTIVHVHIEVRQVGFCWILRSVRNTSTEFGDRNESLALIRGDAKSILSRASAVARWSQLKVDEVQSELANITSQSDSELTISLL